MKKIISYLIIFAICLLASTTGTTAIEAKYKNNLLNVELSQTPDNKVSVLLVFEHPYNDPVKVVYKSDNEYNILLPETYHSVTSVSTLNALNIRSANVKLVPYFNQSSSNGYTKIVIKTTRPVVFSAHASYVSPSTRIANNDNDLLNQLEEKPVQFTPTKVKSTTKTKTAVKKKTTTKKYVAKKPATTVKKKRTATTTAYKNTKTKRIAKTHTYKKKTVTQTRVATKPIQKPVAKQQPKPVQQAKPIQSPQPQPKAVEQQPLQPQSQHTVAEVQKPITNLEQNEINNNIDNTNQIKTSTNQTDDNTALIVLIVSSIALLGLLLKVFSQTTTKYTNKYNKLKKKPTPQKEPEIPNTMKNMSWQEKFKFMKEQEQATIIAKQEEQKQEISNQLDNIYDSTQNIQQEGQTTPIQTPTYEEQVSEIVNEEPLQMTNDPFNLHKEPVNEGFAPAYQKPAIPAEEVEALNDISDIEPVVDKIYEQKAPDKEALEVEININEPYATNPIEPTLINQTKISKTKGFYLIRYDEEVALMGYINDKVFLLHSFKKLNQTFVQTRLTEKKRGADIYLVRSDNYKALVQVSKDEMKTLINL